MKVIISLLTMFAANSAFATQYQLTLNCHEPTGKSYAATMKLDANYEALELALVDLDGDIQSPTVFSGTEFTYEEKTELPDQGQIVIDFVSEALVDLICYPANYIH